MTGNCKDVNRNDGRDKGGQNSSSTGTLDRSRTASIDSVLGRQVPGDVKWSHIEDSERDLDTTVNDVILCRLDEATDGK